MKTATKKRNLFAIIICAIVCAACSLLGAFGVKTIVNAEDQTNGNEKVFVMDDVASLRYNADKPGVRFRVKMDEQTKNEATAAGATLGFVISLTDYVQTEKDGAEDYVNMFAKLDLNELIIAPEKIYEEEGYYYANAVVNTLEKNFEKSYTAVAYIKTGESYTYADFSRVVGGIQSRTLQEVASKVYFKEPANHTKLFDSYATLGTEQLPILVSESDMNDYKDLAADGATAGKVFKFTDVGGGEVTGTLPSGHSIDQIRAVSDSDAITFSSDVIENGRYRLYLPTGAYRLYFESATHEGVISNITPQSAGAVTADLDSMSQKLYGAENGSCRADWQMTQTGTYSVTVSDSTSANYWTGNYFGSAQNFMVKVRIQNLQNCGQGGIVFRTKSETAILRIKPEDKEKRAYVGVMAIRANKTTGAWEPLSFNGNDFTITVVKDASGVKFYVNDVLFGDNTYQTYPFSALGNDVKIGLGLYQATGTVTFSEYSFVTDEESIAEYIAQPA